MSYEQQPFKRRAAFGAIISEREYQNQRWAAEPPHSITEWLTYIQNYALEAQNIVTRKPTHDADPEALHIIRKIGAMAVACMEEHGAPYRKEAKPTSRLIWKGVAIENMTAEGLRDVCVDIIKHFSADKQGPG